MRAYWRMAGLLWVMAVLSGAQCLSGVAELDKRLDLLEAGIDSLGGKDDRTPEEDAALAKLEEERDKLLLEREDKRKKAQGTGSVLAAILGGLGAVLGVPVLIGVGGAIRNASQIPERKKK